MLISSALRGISGQIKYNDFSKRLLILRIMNGFRLTTYDINGISDLREGFRFTAFVNITNSKSCGNSCELLIRYFR